MNKLGFVVGFLPWIVFSVVAQRLAANGVAWSATLAVVMIVVALVVARRRHSPVFLNLGSLALFLVIAVVGFAGGPGVDRWLYLWGRPLVGVVIGLLVLATVPFRPFTEEYARQTVPRQYWGSPTFRHVNKMISAVWGVAILVMGLASVAVSALDAHAVDFGRAHLVELALNWVVPIVVIWAAIHFTSTYPDRVRDSSRATTTGPATTTDGATPPSPSDQPAGGEHDRSHQPDPTRAV